MMETRIQTDDTDCDESIMNSNCTHSRVDVVEFGVTTVKITVDLKAELETQKARLKSQHVTNTFSRLQSSINDNQPLDCSVKDPRATVQYTTCKVSDSLIKALNRIKIRRIVLAVILCVLTVGISVPTGLFVVPILLQQGDTSTVEFQLHQNYCKIQEPFMVCCSTKQLHTHYNGYAALRSSTCALIIPYS